MAVVKRTVDRKQGNDSVEVSTWTPLLNGDTGEPLLLKDIRERSIQLAGTLGAGGTCVFEGSNDGTTYYTLIDQASAAISLTALGLKTLKDTPLWVRPRISAGDGTTSLTVVLVQRCLRSMIF